MSPRCWATSPHSTTSEPSAAHDSPPHPPSFARSFSSSPLRRSAQVTIFSPFNLPGTIDGNVAKVGDNIPYADGKRFKLDVYTPQNLTEDAPVVVFFYGGAWKAGDKFEYEFVGRALASQGFVTVIPDYRLYPEVKYPEFLEDGARALKWVEDNIAGYHGDPNRVFLAGHSAGAYNAVMLALDKSFTREFGVTIPINGVAAISGPYDFYPFEYGEVRNAFGEAPNPEGTQPVNLVTPDAPPMLLMSGTSDPIVRVAEHRASGAEAARPGRLGHRDLLRRASATSSR